MALPGLPLLRETVLSRVPSSAPLYPNASSCVLQHQGPRSSLPNVPKGPHSLWLCTVTLLWVCAVASWLTRAHWPSFKHP